MHLEVVRPDRVPLLWNQKQGIPVEPIDPKCMAWECPTWWGCANRGCHHQAKLNYAGTIERKPMPGDPDYLCVNDRTEMVGSYNVVAANYGAYKRKGV